MAAFTINNVTVTTTPIAVHSAGPTSVTIRNNGTGVVYIGLTGAGNQKFALASGDRQAFTILATEVLFAVSDSGSNQITYFST